MDTRAAEPLGQQHWRSYRVLGDKAADNTQTPGTGAPGLLAFAKRFTRPRLEAACVVALELGTTNTSHVRNILVSGRDQVQPA